MGESAPRSAEEEQRIATVEQAMATLFHPSVRRATTKGVGGVTPCATRKIDGDEWEEEVGKAEVGVSSNGALGAGSAAAPTRSYLSAGSKVQGDGVHRYRVR